MSLVRRRTLLIAAVLRNLRKQLHLALGDSRCDFPLHAESAVGDRGYWRNGDGKVALVRSSYEDPPDALSDADRREWTLDEVGELFGRNRERIRQVEAKALRKLRHPSRARMFDGFLAGRRVVS